MISSTSAPARGERGAQRAVVWRRVGGGIDDLDAHRRRFSPVRLSYCVVNTNGREDLLAGLEAIRATHPPSIDARGAGARQRLRRRLGRRRPGLDRRRRRARRQGAADRARPPGGQGGERHAAPARGPRRALPAAERGLRAAPRAPPRRWSRRSTPTPGRRPPARSCSPPTAPSSPAPGGFPGWAPRSPRRCSCTGALVTQSGGSETREVGWVQSAAMLVRRDAAEQVGYLDPRFFVYSDEIDFCKRLRDAGFGDPLRAGRACRPPRAARDRPLGRRAARDRVPPRPRRLHAKAPRPGRRGDRPRPRRLELRAASPRRRWSCRANRRAGTGSTPAARSAPTRARG